jgi:uncharacterized protein
MLYETARKEIFRMPMFFFDWTMILLLPALALAMWAQGKVKFTYAKFSQVATRRGLTGADAARLILNEAGITPLLNTAREVPAGACGIEAIGGELTDHYDPSSRMLRLSEDIYAGRSVAALGIAAHEAGHAIQHANNYAPLMLRGVIYPVANIGTMLAFPLFFIGLFVAKPLITAAILLYTVAVAFTLITLPVEFDASHRALKALSHGGYLNDDELYGARKVLSAAAMTYVAAAAMAIMQLVRMLIIAGNERE